MPKMPRMPKMQVLVLMLLLAGSVLGAGKDAAAQMMGQEPNQMQLPEDEQTVDEAQDRRPGQMQSQMRQIMGQGQMQVQKPQSQMQNPGRGQGQMQNPGLGQGQMQVQNPQGQMQNPGRGQGQMQYPNQGQGQMQTPGRGQGQMQVQKPPGQSQIQVQGSGYKKCGHYKCVNDPGVVCDRGKNKCSCPKRQVGNGRIKCADPDKSCLCTIHGDPHVINFKGQTFVLPLPCSHMIADLTTPGNKFVSKGCKVTVIGRAWYTNKGREDSIVTYENQIDIRVETRRSRFTARISRTGAPITNLTRLEPKGKGSGSASKGRGSASKGTDEDDDDSVETKGIDIRVSSDLDDADFYEINIPACELMIKYRGRDGSFALLTPVKSVDSAGLCGKCKKRWDRPPNEKPPTPKEVLKTLLTSLWGKSPVDGSDINIYPSCSQLTDYVRTCRSNRKEFALGFCGEMLTDRGVRQCMSVKYGKRNVQSRFSECYKNVCSGPRSCKEYSNVFSGCPASHVTRYLKMAGFCKR